MVDLSMASSMSSKLAGVPLLQPVIAFVGIFDKHNEPVVMQNYLARHLQKESDEKLELAAQNLGSTSKEFSKVKKAAKRDMKATEMQMAMLAYSTLDIFSDKAYVIPDRVRFEKEAKDKQQGKEIVKETEHSFLGLLM